ncbi:MAG: fumarylacetoacetate hydrolase family protein [Thermoplasmataceae archaeon]
MKLAIIETEDGAKHTFLYSGKFYDLQEYLGINIESGSRTSLSLLMSKISKAGPVDPDDLRGVPEYSPLGYHIPVSYVNQIRDFYSFEEHVSRAKAARGVEFPKEWYEFPAYYYSGTSALYASDQDVPYPSFTKELDFELEVAAVIAKEGKNIPKSEAWNYIFGFMLANDWSARDQQRKENKIGLGPSKSKDFATSFGRILVTADELKSRMNKDGQIDEDVWAKINGELFTKNNLKTIYWSFQDMISWASTDTTLRPGDIIMSGTVGGGCILEQGNEHREWLKRGDTVILGSTTLGELHSRIV